MVADLYPELARSRAEQYGIGAAGAAAEALARDDVEIIVNLTIPAAHADVASAALAAGKHVWNEKPLALERDSGAALVRQAADAGLLLGCAPDTFLGPGLQTAFRMISRGDIGRPLTASMQFLTPGPHSWHPNPEFLYQNGGGPLLDMAPYYLTAAAQVFGAATGVAARAGTMADTRTIGSGPRAGEVFAVTVPTYVSALLDYAGGEIAAATFSFDSPLVRMGVLEIAGTDATIALPDAAGAGRGIGVLDIARALRGGTPHRATGELGCHVLDAMHATLESARASCIVRVGSTFAAVDPLPAEWNPLARTV